MGTSYGASKFPSLFNSCILWAPLQHSAGVSGDIDEFPIIPAGVTVTNNGTFTKDDLGNNKSVLKFDGSTNYISLTDSTSWNIFGSDFTICGWIKLKTVTESHPIMEQEAVEGDANNYWVLTCHYALQKLTLYAKVSGSTTFDYRVSFSPTANTWYHVVVQRSGSSCLMFIDGITQSVATVTAWTGTTDIAQPLTIGHDYTDWMKGNLKDLMIFTRALSLPEIKLLMNRTHPVTGAGLIDTGKYWRLS